MVVQSTEDLVRRDILFRELMLEVIGVRPVEREDDGLVVVSVRLERSGHVDTLRLKKSRAPYPCQSAFATPEPLEPPKLCFNVRPKLR